MRKVETGAVRVEFSGILRNNFERFFRKIGSPGRPSPNRCYDLFYLEIEKSIEVSLSLNRYYYCELKEEIIFVNLNIGANIKPPKDRVM